MSDDTAYARIGRARSAPHAGGRRDLYGVYQHLVHGGRYARYEGHEDAEGRVTGLPSAGVHAWWKQLYIPLDIVAKDEGTEVTLFVARIAALEGAPHEESSRHTD
jgi:hypothetical protein